MTIVVPALGVPVELRVSPHAGAADLACRAFLRDHGVARGLAADDYLTRTAFGAMAGCMYPDGHSAELCHVAEWMGLWSIVDDQLERLGARESPEVFDAVCDAIGSWVGGPATPGTLAPARAFRAVWSEIAATTPSRWQRRFLHAFHRHLDGCRWEAEQARTGTIPDETEYLRWRPLFFGAYVAMALAEYALGAELPPALVGDPLLDRTVATGIELMIISNDLLSADIEEAQGSTVNLVAILGAAEGCTPQQSADRLAEMYDRRLVAYQDLLERLDGHCRGLGLDEAQQAAVSSYARAPMVWTRGQIAWSTGNPRYTADRAAFYEAIPDHIGDLARAVRDSARR